MLFSNLQAVTVKEALSTKARHLRRSLSTPSVHTVSTPCRGLPQGLGAGLGGQHRLGPEGRVPDGNGADSAIGIPESRLPLCPGRTYHRA